MSDTCLGIRPRTGDSQMTAPISDDVVELCDYEKTNSLINEFIGKVANRETAKELTEKAFENLNEKERFYFLALLSCRVRL
jgi:hypothetical protein